MNSRRDFIRASLIGASTCALGSSMTGTNIFGASTAAHATHAGPKRFVFMRACNGLWPRKLALPSFSSDIKRKEASKQAFEVGLDKHELPEYLQCLDAHKQHLTILQGMSSKMSLNGHHSYQSVMGLFRAKNANINTLKRASVDYELAKLFPSPLGHVELSFAMQREGIVDGWCVPAPYQKNFCYADPITAYNNLFQCVLDPDSLRTDIEMFDYIHRKEGRITTSVTGPDRPAQENHLLTLDAIGRRNTELLGMRSKIASLMPDKQLVEACAEESATSVQKQAVMADIAASILAAGLTNVVTYTLDSLDFNNTGVEGVETSPIHSHGIGHNSPVQGVPAEEIRKRLRVHHFNQVRKLVEKLKAQPEGSGTMFDNTMIMYFPEGGEAHHGGGSESPWVVMSGKNCNLDIAGRYVRFPGNGLQGHQTLGNWYTSLLNSHGNPIKHYGDLDTTMARKRLPQEGAIKQFMRKA